MLHHRQRPLLAYQADITLLFLLFSIFPLTLY